MQVGKLKVLIVDDDPLVRSALRSYLENRSLLIAEAVDGRDALRMLRAHADVEVVITDILMPNLEGMGLIKELKRRYPAVKIIAMSGGGLIDAREYLHSALYLGADRVLSKPFAMAELESSLAAL